MTAAPNDPEALYAAFREEGQTSEERFESLCAAHPELAERLRDLHSDYLRMVAALGGEVETRTAGPARAGTGAWDALLDTLRERHRGRPRYVEPEEVARGGMGVIHRVRDVDFDRRLAMKVLLDGGRPSSADGSSPLSVGRFLDEARVTGQLDHPGIVPVHDLGVDERGRLFFTMKLVHGDDLRAVIDRMHDPEDQDWSLARALSVVQRVCEAMTYAHAKNVVHRDLKPANVMVGRFGEAYVMDWGLAKVIDETVASPDDSIEIQSVRPDSDDTASPLVTMDGDVVGTPAYMAPEQAAGDVAAVGPSADVYAVGAILYHLLTRRMPFVEPGQRLAPHAVLALVLSESPTPVEQLAPRTPAELVAICEKAMERRIEDRYSSMEALGADLRAYLEGRVVAAHRTGAIAELGKWIKRNRAVTTVTCVAIALLFAATALFVTNLRAERDNAKSALERSRRSLARAHMQQAMHSGSPTERFLNAARSIDLRDSPEARDLLLQSSPYLLRPTWARPLGSGAVDLALSRDGRLAAASLDDGRIVIVDVPRRIVVREIETGAGRGVDVDLDDGGAALTASWPGALRRWNLTRPMTAPVTIDGDQNAEFGFFTSRISPDGAYVLRLDGPGSIELRDGASLEVLERLDDFGYGPEFDFLPRGDRVAFWAGEPTLEIRSLPTLDVVRSIDYFPPSNLDDFAPIGLEVSPDGAWAALATTNEVTLVSLVSGEQEVLPAPGVETGGVAWSPDSAALVLSRLHGSLNVFDVRALRSTTRFDADPGRVRGAMAHDGTILSVGSSGLLASWPARSSQRFHEGAAAHLAGAANVRRVAFLDPVQNELGVIDLATGELLWSRLLADEMSPSGVALSAGGETVAAFGMDVATRVFDARTGAELVVLEPSAAVVPSHDGRRIHLVTEEELRTIDLATDVTRAVENPHGAVDLHLSADGERALLVGFVGLQVVRLLDGEIEREEGYEVYGIKTSASRDLGLVARGFPCLPELLEVESGRVRWTVQEACFPEAFVVNDSLLASVDADLVTLRSVLDGSVAHLLEVPGAYDTARVGDETTLATSGVDGIVVIDLRLRDWPSGECLERAHALTPFRMDEFELSRLELP